MLRKPRFFDTAAGNLTSNITSNLTGNVASIIKLELASLLAPLARIVTLIFQESGRQRGQLLSKT